VDAELTAQGPDVDEQVVSRVLAQVDARALAPGVLGPRPPWANTMIGCLAGSRYRRHRGVRPTPDLRAERRAVFHRVPPLPVDEIGVANLEQSVVVGIDLP
jgi:hypothetical protein